MNSAKDINAHVARRLLAARRLAGMSQENAAEVLGLTFQQVQKYERGANRISMGYLVLLARAYGQPIEFFFDGIDRPDRDANDATSKFFALPYAADLASSYVAIDSNAERHVVLQVARALSEKGGVE